LIFANMFSQTLGLEKVYEIPKELTLGSLQSDDLAHKVKINKMANGYRLPMAAEWGYAAKGGKNYKYAGSNDLNEVGWYNGNSGAKTHCVGKKKPNDYGLYDMSGNVWEWCFDKSPNDLSRRVRRGGSWSGDSGYCEVSTRSMFIPSSRYYFFGIRLFRTVTRNY
jgi:sulfatase modifying factor 1